MKQICLFAILIILPTSLFAQTTVSTVVNDPSTPFTDDIIMDASGNLYCADYSGDAVFKRTPSGAVTEFVSGLNTPNGLAFNSLGDLYVCDNIGNRIYILNSSGTPIDTIITGLPSGIIKDIASDTMIFTTYGSQGSLKKLAPDGSVSEFHTGAPLNGPVGLEYSQGELYVANFTDREIYRVEADTLIFVAQLPGSGALGFLGSIGNYLLATAFNGHKVYSVDPSTGDVNIYAGSSFGTTDGALDSAKFTTPNGIYVTPTDDTIYVSEYNTGNLRMITGLTLGSNWLNKNDFVTIYPNPASESATVSANGSIKFDEIILIDVQGKVLMRVETLASDSCVLDFSDSVTGACFVQILSKGVVVATESIVIQ